MPKTFDRNACGDRHQRPINSKCTRISDSEPEDGISNHVYQIMSFLSQAVLQVILTLRDQVSFLLP